MRLLVTRPEPDALRLRAALEQRGHAATVDPLMRVSFEDCDPIELDGVQALIATSRNGLRALQASPALVEARRLPLFAVGRATAAKARDLGIEVVVTGAGTATGLVSHIASAVDPAAGLLLHLAGDMLAADLEGALEAHGFRLAEPIVYRMVSATGFSPETMEQLAFGEIEGVILLSPRTATIYADLMGKHGLATFARQLTHYCLSRAVAGPLASLGTVPTAIPAAPRLEEVLALIDTTAAQLQG